MGAGFGSGGHHQRNGILPTVMEGVNIYRQVSAHPHGWFKKTPDRAKTAPAAVPVLARQLAPNAVWGAFLDGFAAMLPL